MNCSHLVQTSKKATCYTDNIIMDWCGVMLDPRKKRYLYSMLSIFGAISLSLLFFFLLYRMQGAFGIGGCVGRGAVTYNNVRNAGNVTVTSDFAAASWSKIHPIYVAGVFGYGTTGANKKLYNSGAINVSGNHAIATGLYVSGIYGRGSNSDSNTYEECENTGAISVSATTTSTVKVAGIVSYQIRGTQKDSFNDAPLSFTGKCTSLYIGGVSTDDAAKVKFINCDNREKGVITVNGDLGTANYSYVGGICSFMEGAAEMTDCQNDADINYTNTVISDGDKNKYKTRIGGLIGYSSSKSLAVTNCANNGALNLSNPLKYVGGCFGHVAAAVNFSNWTNIKNTGDITWAEGVSHVPYVGGVLGCSDGSGATGIIKDWHNSGNIYAQTTRTKNYSLRTFIGGIAGLANVYQFSYCSSTGDVIAPYLRNTGDMTTWVGLLTGKRYVHTGSTGTSTPTATYVDHCLIKGNIKRYKMDKSGVEECEVDTVEEIYKFAFADQGNYEGDNDPTKYFTDCYATGEFIPETPAQE